MKVKLEDLNPDHVDEALVFFRTIFRPDLKYTHKARITLVPEGDIKGRKIKTIHYLTTVEEFEKLLPFLVEHNRRGYHIYLGVVRFEPLPGAPEGEPDFKVHPGSTVFWDDDSGIGLDAIYEKVEAAGMPLPAMAVETSPDCFHGHYPTEQVLESVLEFQQVQAGLWDKCQTCNGVGKSTQLIRVPGPFFNCKPDKTDHRVTLWTNNTDQVFDISEFPHGDVQKQDKTTGSDYAIEVEPKSLSDWSRDVIENGLPEGEARRPNLYKLFLDMTARGWSDDEILEQGRRLGKDAGLKPHQLKDLRRNIKNAKKGDPCPAFAKDEQAELEFTTPKFDEGHGADLDEVPDWPRPPDLAFSHGLVKELVDRVDGRTEADLSALVFQFLTYFGNVIGRSAYFEVEGDQHFTNLFMIVCGVTANGRKGTSTGIINKVFREEDSDWYKHCRKTGISTGEGLISMVRDEVRKQKFPKPTKDNPDPDPEIIIVDEGVDDKRALVVVSEFAAVSKVAGREGNILYQKLRDFWDGMYSIETNTKTSPVTTTGAHVSMIGHVTQAELGHVMAVASDVHGGTFNRFLWVLSRRARLLPRGGDFLDLETLQDMVQRAIHFAKAQGEIGMTDEAWKIYDQFYYQNGTQPVEGLTGAVLSRAEPQLRRMAMILALTRHSDVVDVEDIGAALDLWRYAKDSTRRIFVLRESVTDKAVMKVVGLIRNKPGIARSEIYKAMDWRDGRKKFDALLKEVMASGLVRCENEKTAGAPKTIFFPETHLPDQTSSRNKPPYSQRNGTYSGLNGEKENPVKSLENKAETNGETTADPLLRYYGPPLNKKRKSKLKPGESVSDGGSGKRFVIGGDHDSD